MLAFSRHAFVLQLLGLSLRNDLEKSKVFLGHFVDLCSLPASVISEPLYPCIGFLFDLPYLCFGFSFYDFDALIFFILNVRYLLGYLSLRCIELISRNSLACSSFGSETLKFVEPPEPPFLEDFDVHRMVHRRKSKR